MKPSFYFPSRNFQFYDRSDKARCRQFAVRIIYGTAYRSRCPQRHNAVWLFRKQTDGKCSHVVQAEWSVTARSQRGAQQWDKPCPPQSIRAQRWRFDILQCLWQVRFATVGEMICEWTEQKQYSRMNIALLQFTVRTVDVRYIFFQTQTRSTATLLKATI